MYFATPIQADHEQNHSTFVGCHLIYDIPHAAVEYIVISEELTLAVHIIVCFYNASITQSSIGTDCLVFSKKLY